MKIKQLARSNTVKFNTLIPALFVFLKAFEIEVPADVVTGILAIGNFLLRLVTKEPISSK